MNEAKREEVYQIVKSIPKGKVLRYQDVACMASLNAPRAVGYYLHCNPDSSKIPCHRVVNSKGALSGSFAFGGPNEQEKRLASEGVLLKNGRVDLEEYLWK